MDRTVSLSRALSRALCRARLPVRCPVRCPGSLSRLAVPARCPGSLPRALCLTLYRAGAPHGTGLVLLSAVTTAAARYGGAALGAKLRVELRGYGRELRAALGAELRARRYEGGATSGSYERGSGRCPTEGGQT